MAIRAGDLIILDRNDRSEDRTIQRDAKIGKIRRVSEGIYVINNDKAVEEIICGQWAAILARYAPGAVLQGRSAIRKGVWRAKSKEGIPEFPGWLFAVDPNAKSRGRRTLPGLEIRTVPGVGPLEGDMPFLGIYLPSDARSLLENLKPARTRSGPARTIGQADVEIEVERLFSSLHRAGMKELRSRAERLAPALHAEAELARLLDVIGTVAGTRQAPLRSPLVAARRRATEPYDPECMERMKSLATSLNRIVLPDRPDPHTAEAARTSTSFVEAYFTNYIEGTRFLVDKAKRIVFDGDDPDGRPQDGRDVTQSYAQLVRFAKGDTSAATASEFMDEVKERNRSLLDSRPDRSPGLFKTEPNLAGNTVFVMPALVEGTLREGFAMLGGIEHPFARGLFIHALLVLVHPFNDGNGRTSRIMMTKELVRNGQSRAIVPTVYRSDYIGGLRALSRTSSPQAAPIIRALLRCQEATSKISTADLRGTIELWASTNAFLENERAAQFVTPDPHARIEWRRGIPAPETYWRDLDIEAQLSDDDPTSIVGFHG